MKRVCIMSLISALVITLAGTALNLMTYFMYGKMILATTVEGGKHGFGLLIRQAAGAESTLSIDIMSFILPLLALFLFTLFIQWRKYVIIRKAREGK